MSPIAQIGQRRSYDGALCTVRYIGEVVGTTGTWLGVEWDDPERGKHDGQHKGVRYFSCKSKSPTAASFIRPTRPTDAPQSFLTALQLKYASDPTKDQDPPKQIVFSGKVAEEVGFDKVRRKQAQLGDLQFVILDGVQVAYASHPDGAGDGAKDGRQSIGQVCPKVRELDLSRSLFDRFGTVVEICSELRLLRSLRVNGNRFQHVLEDGALETAGDAFGGVTELGLEDTLLEWAEICHVAARFPCLSTLYAGSNQLESLTPIPPVPFTSTLVSLHLECNDFSSLADIAPLSAISSLRNLLLKGNRITDIVPPSSPSDAPVFGANLHYLDISYNQVASWSFVDALSHSFPGLTSLRFTHNPIYDDPELDNQDVYAPAQRSKGVSKTDEAYMLMVARMPSLNTLNFSNITTAHRADAEMFYLSRIVRQLAAVPKTAEGEVLARHRRWTELCELYGEPPVVRQRELNPTFLEARLISVEFYFPEDGRVDEPETRAVEKRSIQIPKSFDIYTVKGIVGKLFGLPPLKLRLVWETGEWDPVAGFDEEAGDSSDEEETEAEWEKREEAGAPPSEAPPFARKGGRWVKREVELKDGPRQFGYCVDGLEARIRVERR
ncbi:hypothetical protein MFIFM68171_00364 [Madurella fahalii]|uniref:CAP-Gly domain-containing protein n=1 Tax=Madurella fahalii TaxID=1157608 RepID=A0ABQ0FXL6_9PEZI